MIDQSQIDNMRLTTASRQDGYLLHFLKEFPAWCILLVLIILFLTMYQITREDFIPRIIDGLVGAMLTAIIAQRPRTQQATNIKTDTVETQSMDDSTVNAANFNVDRKGDK